MNIFHCRAISSFDTVAWTANRLKNELEAKGFKVEPTPRRGMVEDAQLIDDWNKRARNRVVGFGIKSD